MFPVLRRSLVFHVSRFRVSSGFSRDSRTPAEFPRFRGFVPASRRARQTAGDRAHHSLELVRGYLAVDGMDGLEPEVSSMDATFGRSLRPMWVSDEMSSDRPPSRSTGKHRRVCSPRSPPTKRKQGPPRAYTHGTCCTQRTCTTVTNTREHRCRHKHTHRRVHPRPSALVVVCAARCPMDACWQSQSNSSRDQYVPQAPVVTSTARAPVTESVRYLRRAPARKLSSSHPSGKEGWRWLGTPFACEVLQLTEKIREIPRELMEQTTVPPETHSDLIPRAQKIEFESC